MAEILLLVVQNSRIFLEVRNISALKRNQIIMVYAQKHIHLFHVSLRVEVQLTELLTLCWLNWDYQAKTTKNA